MVQAKLSVTMLAGHCCIRVHKMAMPLFSSGYRINLIVNKYPLAFKGIYDSIQVYENHDHLWNAIRAIDPFTDIYHCHNEPNWFVSAVKEISTKPVILDWHDTFLLRRTRSEKEKYRVITEERNNAFLADGFVFPCGPLRSEVYYDFEAVREIPSIILWSYVPRGFYHWDFFEWLGGICYQGRVDHEDILKNKKYDFFSYSIYKELAERLKRRAIPFHIYAPEQKIVNWFSKRNLIAGGGCLAFDDLIKAIGRHDWGLVGNIGNHREWQKAMPNKVFEYIAAQMPVVALNASHAGKWLEKEGIGINIKTLDELEERWDEHHKCRETLTKKRLDYCMENHIHLLEDLYGQVISHSKKNKKR